jgi:glycosyltransferase involved in cell wall biosynthesis
MRRRPAVVVLAPEPIRPRMAGMGIRALELARAIGREFDVRLLVPNDAAEAEEASGGVPVVTAAPDSDLARAAAGARVAVVSAHAANYWFHQVPDVPVVADLYDPFPIENLHYARTLGEETARHDRETLQLALARADYFLCASREQRLFYAGALFAAGRIGPANFPDDPSLTDLVALVPFGTPDVAAAGDRSAGRRAVSVPDEGPLVLFGGIYDWSDPALLLEAWPAVLRAEPSARLLFLESPNPETTPQRVYEETVRRARSLDPAGASIRFLPWVPYDRREDLYAAADLLVSISSNGLESDLAYRTRLLDAAWGGLTSISIAGGTLARELEEAGAGRRVERSSEALASAVVDALQDPQGCAARAREGRRFAAERKWETVARPLLSWCRRARIDPLRLPLPEPAEPPFWRRFGRRG